MCSEVGTIGELKIRDFFPDNFTNIFSKVQESTRKRI
jgi:hypothetical protein